MLFLTIADFLPIYFPGENYNIHLVFSKSLYLFSFYAKYYFIFPAHCDIFLIPIYVIYEKRTGIRKY